MIQGDSLIMKIYSIKEIVKATNDLLSPESKILFEKNNKIKKLELPPETEKIIIQAEKSIEVEKNDYPSNEEPLELTKEIPNKNINKINSYNYNIKIKSNVKDHMINELYLYLKKKVRKNTLRLIIDEQFEIKNLKKKIDILKKTQNDLKDKYQALKNNYELALVNNKNLEINKVLLNNEINKLTIDNGVLQTNLSQVIKSEKQLNTEILELRNNNQILQNNLNQITAKKGQLDLEVKELKIDNGVLQTNLSQVIKSEKQLNTEILELRNNNQILQNNLNQITAKKGQLDLEVKELKIDLNKTKLNLKENIEKNKAYEINNSELKNTVSSHIVDTKKTQEKLNLAEQSNNLNIDTQNEKVRFYQEENIRLSSELLATQKKNEMIKENLNSIEIEKEQISNMIKDLNKTIGEKANIISSNFVKENIVRTDKKTEVLNDKEQKSLDEVINRIFAKI